MKKIFKATLMFVLAFTMLFTVAGCSKEQEDNNKNTTTVPATTEKKITITVDVKKSDNSTKTFTIETTAKNLEDALLQENLVEGEESEYGLYIKKVDGEVADYDKDKAFWSISKDGQSLVTGAKDTTIADGEHYTLAYTISE